MWYVFNSVKKLWNLGDISSSVVMVIYFKENISNTILHTKCKIKITNKSTKILSYFSTTQSTKII